jgi:hypothetical protein
MHGRPAQRKAGRRRSFGMDAERNSEGQAYELFMFARKHGISIADARDILDKFGADREGADKAAKTLKDGWNGEAGSGL